MVAVPAFLSGLRPAFAVFALALTALLLVTPLSAGSTQAAEAVARGLALRTAMDPKEAPLALLFSRAAAFLPLGQVAMRSHIVSALLGALAAALLFLRVRAGLRGAPDPTSPEAAPDPLELVAALLATVAVCLARSFLQAFTVAGSGAICAALLTAALLLAHRIAHEPSRSHVGLGLAVLAGLCALGPPALAALVWPPAFLLTVRSLRGGERWPLFAPLLFVAAAGSSALLVLRANGSPGAAELFRHLALTAVTSAAADLSVARVAVTAAELVDEMGVIALLVAAFGLLRMTARPSAELLLSLWVLAAGLLLGAALGPAAALVVTLATLLGLTSPLAAGIAALAVRLGRARLPAAVALGFMVAVWPAFDGARALAQARRRDLAASRLVDAALLTAPPGATLQPRSPEIGGWLDYSRALGVRSDLICTSPACSSPTAAEPPARTASR